jgi:hypothetical protein
MAPPPCPPVLEDRPVIRSCVKSCVEPLPASSAPLPPVRAFASALPLEPFAIGRPGRRSLRRWRRLVLACCGLLSTLALAAIPADGLHPLALMAGLLPLQVVGLLWGVAQAS